MSTQKPCANRTLHGCEGLVNRRGMILCDSCLEQRRTQLQDRRSRDIEKLTRELREVRAELEHQQRISSQLTNECKSLQEHLQEMKELNTESNRKIKQLIEENNAWQESYENKKIDSVQLNKYHERLSNRVRQLSTENERLVKGKAEYEINYQQMRLDVERWSNEVKRLSRINENITAENESLRRENRFLMQVNGELDKKCREKENPPLPVNKVPALNLPKVDSPLTPEEPLRRRQRRKTYSNK